MNVMEPLRSLVDLKPLLWKSGAVLVSNVDLDQVKRLVNRMVPHLAKTCYATYADDKTVSAFACVQKQVNKHALFTLSGTFLGHETDLIELYESIFALPAYKGYDWQLPIYSSINAGPLIKGLVPLLKQDDEGNFVAFYREVTRGKTKAVSNKRGKVPELRGDRLV